MAQECGFFNAQLVGEDEYDRVYLAEQFAAYFASFIGNGVYGTSMQKLEVIAQTDPDMSVRVLAGEAWINGWWYRNTDEYTLSLDIGDGVLSRIDLIVLRWGNKERDMWLRVIKGEASSNPVAPQIVRNADYYDLQLASITVAKGAFKITQSSIEDTRSRNDVCGWVTGVVDQIDTTDLYNQFTTYFNEFKTKHEADFDEWTKVQTQEYLTYIAQQKGLLDNYIAKLQSDYDTWTMAQKQSYDTWYTLNTTQWSNQFDNWFDSIKLKLDGNVAGNLQLQIDELESRQPTDVVANIAHNMDDYICCDMYETTYACGVGGAGEGPAGGGSLISTPVEYEMTDRNNINVKAIAGFGQVQSVDRLGSETVATWVVLFNGNTPKSLVIRLSHLA